MIIFDELSIRNFLSYGNIPTIIKLSGYSKTLICGANGSGKTAIINALSFVLFGKTPRKITLPQMVNSINNRECEVSITFFCNNKKYKVFRSMKPSILHLYENDVLVDKETDKKDYQRYLEDFILQTDYKTFMSVVMIGGKNYTPFMNQPKGDRRQISESFLDIDIFSFMNKVAKEKLDELQVLLNIQNTQINSMKREIDLTNHSIDKVKSIFNKNKEEDNNKILSLKKQIEEIDLAIKEIDISLLNIKEEYGCIYTIEEELSNKKNELINRKNNHENVINDLSSRERFYLTTTSCPTCKQNIDEEIKNKFIIGIQERVKKINSSQNELIKTLEEFETIYKEVKNTLNIVTNNNTKKTQLLFNKHTYLNIIDELQKNNNKVSSHEELIELESLLIKKLNDLNKLTEEINKLKDEYEYYNFAVSLLKDDGIKSSIIKEFLPQINTIINQYLEQLDLFIDFNFDENFNESIRSRYRDTFTYESFSDGQKMKIDIALLYTWREITARKNSLNLNILFCDELFDQSLDPISTELTIKMLNTLPPELCCFIISHKVELFESRVDRFLKIEQNHNFSTIQEII